MITKLLLQVQTLTAHSEYSFTWAFYSLVNKNLLKCLWADPNFFLFTNSLANSLQIMFSLFTWANLFASVQFAAFYSLMWTTLYGRRCPRHVGAMYRQYNTRLGSKYSLIQPVFRTRTHHTVWIFVHCHQLFAHGVLGFILRSVESIFFKFLMEYWFLNFFLL